MIESATKDGVAVLAMRHGKANALDTELCQALCGALDDGAAAVVLTGAGTVFSAGVDLKRVVAGRRSASPSASYGSGSSAAFTIWPSSTPRSMRSGRPRPPWNASSPS